MPLWAIDYTDDVGTGDEPRYRAKRCWMTDGGLTANFPVHFFDSPFPARPTFAIDLQSYPDRYPDQDVYYPGPGQSGLQPRFKTITSVQGFAAGLLDTMQYWADNAQATLPGYRDRIVQVRLRPDEGGMNLQMPDDVVRRAAEKGRQAAEVLRERFDFDDHRWIRYLTVIGRMQQTVDRMESRWDHDLPGGSPGYHDFVLDRASEQPFSRTATWRSDGRRPDPITALLRHLHHQQTGLPDEGTETGPRPAHHAALLTAPGSCRGRRRRAFDANRHPWLGSLATTFDVAPASSIRIGAGEHRTRHVAV